MRFAIAVTALLLAGCFDSGSDDPGTDLTPEPAWKAPDWAHAALPGPEVDHTDPTYWQDKTTPNFEVLGWDPMISGYHGTTSGTTLCGGISDLGGKRLAVTHGFSNDVALMVHDVSDATAPVFLGELVLPRTGVYDATISDDGRWALLAAKAIGDQPDSGPLTVAGLDALPAQSGVVTGPVWRDVCGQEFEGPLDELPYGNGVVLVDLADPRVPTVADFKAVPGTGVHSVELKVIDGTTWAMGSTVGANTGTSFFAFYQVLDQGTLLPTGFFNGVVRQTPEGGVTADTDVFATELHTDGFFHKHPITGQTLGYLSDWDGGLIIVDMANGGNAAIGQWKDTEPARGAEMTGAVHSAFPLDWLIEDRHYTFAGQEVIGRPANRPTGQITMLDTTDPTSPFPVARWTLPVDPGVATNGTGDVHWPTPIAYSTHYFAVHNNTLFTSMYHGGVWAADIRQEHWPELPTVGAFFPSNVSPEKPTIGQSSYGGLFYLTPMVLEVLAYDDGTLVSWDSTSGIYTYRFTEDHPDVEPVAPWVADQWIET